ncbi:MAG: peptidoglycan-binding protein [Clostridia bacterium]|nr:peptidoglycan-binding protein [Clostridia bacterium]MBQ6122562.1 peptidoglycan-binding protein [Clostridia bacterium]
MKTRIKNRSWEKWGMLPASIIDYVEDGSTTVDPEPTPMTKEGCPYAEPSKNQRKGSTGEGVKWVQWMLVQCGYSVGSCGIDGDFGKATHTAVIQFQSEHELETDGIVGALTRAALKAVYDKKKGA